MSYAVQNFYNVNQKLRFNQKLYLLWFCRNIPAIIIYITKSLNIFYLSTLNKTLDFSTQDFFHFFYNNSFYKIFKKLTSTWRPLLGTNYTKSLSYWGCKLGNSLLDETIIKSIPVQISNTQFFNTYFYPVKVSNIPLQNKLYRNVLVRFLHLLIIGWQLWPHYYNIAFRYVLITKNYYVLRFYNQPKYKVFHL
jgi:hypothetical protein